VFEDVPDVACNMWHAVCEHSCVLRRERGVVSIYQVMFGLDTEGEREGLTSLQTVTEDAPVQRTIRHWRLGTKSGLDR
jgi:hypothetical protein